MNLIHFLIYKFESAASDYIRKFVWVVLTVYRYFLKVVAFENEKSNKLYILLLLHTQRMDEEKQSLIHSERKEYDAIEVQKSR